MRVILNGISICSFVSALVCVLDMKLNPMTLCARQLKSKLPSSSPQPRTNSTTDEIDVADVGGLSTSQLRDRISRRQTVVEVRSAEAISVFLLCDIPRGS